MQKVAKENETFRTARKKRMSFEQWVIKKETEKKLKEKLIS